LVTAEGLYGPGQTLDIYSLAKEAKVGNYGKVFDELNRARDEMR
jgi:hypothetical protein